MWSKPDTHFESPCSTKRNSVCNFYAGGRWAILESAKFRPSHFVKKKTFLAIFPGGGGGKVQEDSNGLLVNLFWDKSVALDVTGKLPMRL